MSREKLTIRELAPYLPYGLEMIREDKIHVLTVATFSYRLHDSKPILRPLSDLTKEIEKGFILQSDIDAINNYGISQLKYYVIEYLISNHFDIFGLIPEGLAIDVNTIE